MNFRSSTVRLSATLLACVLVAGCAGGSPCSVSGQVLFDGQPIEAGNIKFDPIDESVGNSGSSPIKDGAYTVPTASSMHAGTFRVSVTANKKTGRQVPQFDSTTLTMDEIVQYIPVRYNMQSELTAELKPGENQQDFKLTR